jgi:hypothetical protein
MKQKLLALTFAGAACIAMQSATPAYAVPVSPPDIITIDGGQFVIDEYNGSYTVFNNSSIWYIYAFGVSNPNALTASPAPSTSFANWNAYAVLLSLSGPNPLPANAYVTADANVSDFNNVLLNSVNLANYIAPGSSSGLFYFAGLTASDAGLLVVDSLGNESQFSSVGNTPLPAALPLFATGLGALGWLTRRRKRNNVAAILAA